MYLKGHYGHPEIYICIGTYGTIWGSWLYHPDCEKSIKLLVSNAVVMTTDIEQLE